MMNAGVQEEPVRWRTLTPTLVVGIAERGVVGSIEIGRRFVVTDGTGHVFGRYRRLGDAQAMLAFLVETGAMGSSPTAT
ncbi:hypothetical protein [uncultured Amnibacterium sp.]|uniref:hypothetical protein n=1 Tax=uncultured Amnibacterium sp. TaxID=1631851 RepID=UPI0035CB4FEE